MKKFTAHYACRNADLNLRLVVATTNAPINVNPVGAGGGGSVGKGWGFDKF